MSVADDSQSCKHTDPLKQKYAARHAHAKTHMTGTRMFIKTQIHREKDQK